MDAHDIEDAVFLILGYQRLSLDAGTVCRVLNLTDHPGRGEAIVSTPNSKFHFAFNDLHLEN